MGAIGRAAGREMRKGELERQTQPSLAMARNLSSAPMLGKCAGVVEAELGDNRGCLGCG